MPEKKNPTPQPTLFKDEKRKLIYRPEEVSRLAKVDSKTSDAWEKEFPFLNAGRTANGKKIFREKDVAIIRRIRELLDLKVLTLAGIKRRIEEEFGLVTPPPVHPERMKKTLYAVRDELRDLAAYLDAGPKKR